jgi:adenosylcobinamide kinase / adenosylcobinamide-phosphate guanylyltransferase
MAIRLVTGGVRSGKSRFAESLWDVNDPVIYIATGQASDDEMKARIEAHRRRRPAHWKVVEEPLRLAEVVAAQNPASPLFIDSLTAWVAQFLFRYFPEDTEGALEMNRRQEFLSTMKEEARHLTGLLVGRRAVVVTDETGWGGIAAHPVMRLFQDALGEVNQEVAHAADEVWIVVSGVPWKVKG